MWERPRRNREKRRRQLNDGSTCGLCRPKDSFYSYCIRTFPVIDGPDAASIGKPAAKQMAMNMTFSAGCAWPKRV